MDKQAFMLLLWVPEAFMHVFTQTSAAVRELCRTTLRTVSQGGFKAPPVTIRKVPKVTCDPST